MSYEKAVAGIWLNRRQAREVDRVAIEMWGVSGLVLMENAGRGVVDVLCGEGQVNRQSRVVVCAAKGNNGGDGFVIARHLLLRGVPVEVLLAAEPGELQGDARANFDILRRTTVPWKSWGSPGGNGGHPREFLERALTEATWIVDALLGTGASGPPREPIAGIIEAMNQSPAARLAVDVPSGLDCESGAEFSPTVQATLTCTLAARKSGFQNPAAARCLGAVRVLDIGFPPELVRSVTERGA